MNTPIFLSIVIPTCNRNDMLAECLDQLTQSVQQLSTDTYEIIVTDDGAAQPAEQMIRAKYPWVRWVKGPCKGPAANRNNGARHAKGNWLVFLDDDCLPDPTLLNAYKTYIEAHPEVPVLEGKIYADRQPVRFNEGAPLNLSGGYLWSCNFCINRKVFEQIGGFDERFPFAAMEDVDLRLVLEKNKQKMVFVPTASVCHPLRPSRGWKHYKQHFESTLIFLEKHQDMKKNINTRSYLFTTARDIVKNFLPNCFKYRFRGAGHRLVYYAANLRGAFLLLSR